ncbi:MAG TPA: hypothetical protein VFJ82_23525 [Longimicrobium sp.]|nr:hypothetical protein [Longimicrobium sp.]
MQPIPNAARRSAALIVCALAATPAAAQVQVTLRPLTPPETFYVADLVPGNTAARPDLIGITLVAERVGQTVSLELTAARESPSPVEIFRGSTAPFVLNQPVRQITSRDLATKGRDVSLIDVTVNHDALEGPAAAGRLPAGTYVFTVTVRNASGAAIDDDRLRITFTSPSRVALLSPGAPADMPPPEVLGPTPRFLWSADGETPGAQYRLRVVKVDAAAGSAVEALQSGFPAWDAVIHGTSAFYPASSQALRLEPGATYAWQVTRELRGSGGTEAVESPIYWFRVGGPGVPGATGGTLALRFAALLRALGLSELEGFTPVGATLDDGRPLPLDKLEELLTAIEAGEVSVMNVRVR